MGYELNRFTEHVDIEYLCAICHQVLENAVESPHCHHIYCDVCVKRWLSLNSNCPVDRLALNYYQLKPITSSLLNLLLNLEIKCDFDPQGCQAVMRLRILHDHVNSCVFNPNLQITCDKECGLEMSQSEYKTHNCLAKLARNLRRQQTQIALLFDEFRDLRKTLKWLCPNGLIISRINSSSTQLVECPTNQFGKEYSEFCGMGFAQFERQLTHLYPRFETKLVGLGENSVISVGLSYCFSTKDTSNSKCECNGADVIKAIRYYGSSGNLFLKMADNSYCEQQFGPKWECGDVIGCGVRFESRDGAVTVYFTRNNVTVGEKYVKFIDGGLYPTITTYSVGAIVTLNLIEQY